MINRLIEPTSGTISIDGNDTATVDVNELRRSIGYVIQQIGLFPHYTVAENVATVPRLAGWDKARITARVDELLDLVGAARGRSTPSGCPPSSAVGSGSASAWPGRWPSTPTSC